MPEGSDFLRSLCIAFVAWGTVGGEVGRAGPGVIQARVCILPMRTPLLSCSLASSQPPFPQWMELVGCLSYACPVWAPLQVASLWRGGVSGLCPCRNSSVGGVTGL